MITLPLWYVATSAVGCAVVGYVVAQLAPMVTLTQLARLRKRTVRLVAELRRLEYFPAPAVPREAGHDPWPSLDKEAKRVPGANLHEMLRAEVVCEPPSLDLIERVHAGLQNLGRDLPEELPGQRGTKAEHERLLAFADRGALPPIGQPPKLQPEPVAESVVAPVAAQPESWVRWGPFCWLIAGVLFAVSRAGLWVAKARAAFEVPAPIDEPSAVALINEIRARRGEPDEWHPTGSEGHHRVENVVGSIAQRRHSRAAEQRLVHRAFTETTGEWSVLPAEFDLAPLPEGWRDLAAVEIGWTA